MTSPSEISREAVQRKLGEALNNLEQAENAYRDTHARCSRDMRNVTRSVQSANDTVNMVRDSLFIEVDAMIERALATHERRIKDKKAVPRGK